MKNSSLVNRRSNKYNLGLVFGLLIFAALGCNFDLGKSADNTTEPANSEKREITRDLGDSTKSPETEPITKPITKADASKREVPSDEEAQLMAKETLLEFNRAIQKDDFTDFYDTISRTWQKEITPSKFREAFSEFVERKVDISEISSETADFSPKPSVQKEQGFNMLTIAGEYDTQSMVKFELKFIPQESEWKLSRIRVVLGR